MCCMRKKSEGTHHFVGISPKRRDSNKTWFAEYQRILALIHQNQTDEEKLVYLAPHLRHEQFDPVEAIIYPAKIGLSWLVRHLLQDPRIDPLVEESEAFIMACIHGHLEVVQLFLQDGRTNPTIYDDEALFKATQNGHLPIVQYLLSVKEVRHTNRKRGSIFSVACEAGHLAIIRFLMQGDDFISCINGEIQKTARTGNLDVLNLLLTHPEADPSTKYALFIAFRNQFYSLVVRLLYDERIVALVGQQKPLFYEFIHAGDWVLKTSTLMLMAKTVLHLNPLLSAYLLGFFNKKEYKGPLPSKMPDTFYYQLMEYTVLLHEEEETFLPLHSFISHY